MNSSRRTFIQLAGATTAAVMLHNFAATKASAQAASATLPMSFEQCLALTPVQTAEQSPLITASWKGLHQAIGALRSSELKTLISAIYRNPEPLLAKRLDAANRKDIWQELRANGYTEQNADAFLPPVSGNAAYSTIAAPGSGYTSHHAYPGGLVTHLATNVAITRNIVETYVSVYGYSVDGEIAVAAQLLHDLHKPWVFQWQTDGSSRKEQALAGTGEHHTLSLAELLVRKAPAELIVAQACAHTHPGTDSDEKQVVNWLKAASIIAGVDPVAYGLLEKGGVTLPLPRKQEGFLCHLGDHDFVLSAPVVQWTLPVMKEVAMKDYGLSETDCAGKPFHALRNVVYSRFSAMRMANDLAHTGENGVRQAMLGIVASPKAA